MPWIAAIAAAAGAAGGIGGSLAKQGGIMDAGDAQKAAINQMIAKLDSVGMPPDQSAKLILDQYKQAGILTPALESQVGQQVSEFKNIKTDPNVRNMQVKALERMSQMGQAGLTPDERATQRLLQQEVQNQNQANQQAIIQNMQQRGQAGSGAELAARLGGSQNSANMASAGADRVSSMAAQRALQAIAQGSNMAGQLEGQDFGEAATKAGAADQMQRFNVQNQMAIGQRNVGAANQAQAANLGNLQSISNANVGQTNQEQYAALQRQRQNWLDKLGYAQAYASPLKQYGDASANQAEGMGNERGKMWAELGGGASKMMNSFMPSGGGAASGASSSAPVAGK